MRWQYNDGGRAAAGYKGTADDCVVRAIAIATGMEYRDVYETLLIWIDEQYPVGHVHRRTPRNGVYRKTYDAMLTNLDWTWRPTMGIGTGCTVHLRDGELPDNGDLIVKLSRHLVAVVDGVIHDTADPSRGGTRCVYGYWYKE